MGAMLKTLIYFTEDPVGCLFPVETDDRRTELHIITKNFNKLPKFNIFNEEVKIPTTRGDYRPTALMRILSNNGSMYGLYKLEEITKRLYDNWNNPQRV